MFSLASKHDDPNAKLAWSERIGYGTGGFAFNMINGIIGREFPINGLRPQQRTIILDVSNLERKVLQ